MVIVAEEISEIIVWHLHSIFMVHGKPEENTFKYHNVDLKPQIIFLIFQLK